MIPMCRRYVVHFSVEESGLGVCMWRSWRWFNDDVSVCQVCRGQVSLAVSRGLSPLSLWSNFSLFISYFTLHCVLFTVYSSLLAIHVYPGAA